MLYFLSINKPNEIKTIINAIIIWNVIINCILLHSQYRGVEQW